MSGCEKPENSFPSGVLESFGFWGFLVRVGGDYDSKEKYSLIVTTTQENEKLQKVSKMHSFSSSSSCIEIHFLHLLSLKDYSLNSYLVSCLKITQFYILSLDFNTVCFFKKVHLYE